MNDRDIEDTRQAPEVSPHETCAHCGLWEEIGFMENIGDDEWLCADCFADLQTPEEQNA